MISGNNQEGRRETEEQSILLLVVSSVLSFSRYKGKTVYSPKALWCMCLKNLHNSVIFSQIKAHEDKSTCILLAPISCQLSLVEQIKS